MNKILFNADHMEKRKESILQDSDQGTGSKPPGWNGWHFNIRFIARKEPLRLP
jgi:hypothetical protein